MLTQRTVPMLRANVLLEPDRVMTNDVGAYRARALNVLSLRIRNQFRRVAVDMSNDPSVVEYYLRIECRPSRQTRASLEAY